MTSTTRKRPSDDQPFDFNLDTVKSEVDLTPFRVQWAGRRWEFAHRGRRAGRSRRDGRDVQGGAR
jgi:hypothetical protein